MGFGDPVQKDQEDMIKARVEGGALLAAGMDGESMKVLVG